MQGFSTTVLSVGAMVLSSLTTYLTFFDTRYTLSVAVAEVSVQVQSGGSSSNGETSAYYRFFPATELVFSNRGTRPVVVSDLRLMRSDRSDRCEISDESERGYVYNFDTMIVEPGTVTSMAVETGMDNLTLDGVDGAITPPPDDVVLWCAHWVAFDPKGYRREPMTPFFTMSRTFSQEDGARYPAVSVAVDYPREPNTIVAKGLF